MPETAPVSAALRDELRQLFRVMRLIRQHDAYHESRVPAGLAGLLAEIARNDPDSPACHVKDLAARTGLDASTVSRAVSSLVADGLVERRTDPADKRASVLTLTAAGRTALAEKHAWYAGLFAQALGDWSTPELESLLGSLRRMSEDLLACLNAGVTPTRPVPTSDSTPLEAAR